MNHPTIFYRSAILFYFILFIINPLAAQFTGNPLLTGADPEIHYFNGKYYIYPTTVDGKKFHTYSSTDLSNWKDEGVIFDIGPQCSWGEYNGWAPSVVFRNNKYYFYYVAEVKIGVAVGNSPTGPFTDLGYPLIGSDPYTNDIIDPMVFIDDDGQSYIYYGGSGGTHMVIRKLNPDMISLASGPIESTPKNYTEGPYVVKRKGIYYLMYSNGAWYNSTYNVQYSTSNSPTGPWTYQGTILSSDYKNTGPGHHGVLKMPNCDDYYIIYHRYQNGTGDRKICIDHMYFTPSDQIAHVNMTDYGVLALTTTNICPAPSIVSGGVYKLVHKGTNQCLDVLYNSSAEGTNVQQYTDNGNDAQRWVVLLQADGTYKLKHKGTNQFLDVSGNSTTPGGNVQQWSENESGAQNWRIEMMDDGYCKLTHRNTGLCLDVAGNSNQPNTNVQQWTDNSNDAQRWKFELVETPIVSGGIYRIMHKGTNQCLDVTNNSSQDNANVQQYTDNGNDAQRWKIELMPDGFYKLTHKGTNQCLDVSNNEAQAGTNVQQYTDNNTDGQRWKIERMSDGYFKFTHKGTGMCLDVGNNSSAPNTNVAQWVDNGNDAQRWKLDLMPTNVIANGNGDGLTANYFNGMNFETPVYSRKDATINFGWGNGSPDASVNADQFSARWTGQIQPKYSETYTFIVNSDNGRRLWINNQLVIDKWIDDWNIDYSGTINLVAGQKYDIRLEYFENNGGAGCKLEWSSFSQVREVVPQSQLYSNALPSVAITSPANNASVTSPANLGLNVSSSDADGSVAKVDYYSGSNLIASTTSPFTYSWNNVGNGTYTIKAIAMDNRGGVTVSAPVSVTVQGGTGNQSPVVSITSPSNNASFNAPASISLTASASDVDGTVSKVEFFNGTTSIGSATQSPYTISWGNVAAGTYSITARATDNGGATTVSVPVSVTVKAIVVNQAPTVSITSPSNNASFNAPASISLTASASDQDGTISKVEFFNGTTSIGSATQSPYTISWNNVTAGTYSITAKATDNGGATTVSVPVSVTVKSVVTDLCSGLPQYVENGGYVDGSKVKNGGSSYQCKPYPYTGWCNGAAWAYAPGTGAYWTDAWTLVGSCSPSSAPVAASMASFVPNPATDVITLSLNEASKVTISTTSGTVVLTESVPANGTINISALPAGLYTIRMETSSTVLTSTLSKN